MKTLSILIIIGIVLTLNINVSEYIFGDSGSTLATLESLSFHQKYNVYETRWCENSDGVHHSTISAKISQSSAHSKSMSNGTYATTAMAGYAEKESAILLVNLLSKTFINRGQPPIAVNYLAGYARNKFPNATINIINMQEILKKHDNEANVDVAFQRSLDEVVRTIVTQCDMHGGIVGLSVKWESLEGARYIIREVRRALGDRSPIFVLGNVGVTFAYGVLLKEDEFKNTIAVVGEGEDAFVDIIETVTRNPGKITDLGMFQDIQNVAVNVQGAIPKVKRGVVNLDDYPMFTEKIAPEVLVAGDEFQKDSHGLETSRGCPWAHCTYCSICELFGKENEKWRPRPLEHVFNEIEIMVQKGTRKFYIIDSEFCGPTRTPEQFDSSMTRLEDFARGIEALNIKYQLEGDQKIQITHTSVRVDAIYKEGDDAGNKRRRAVFELLKRAGFTKFYLGIESGSDEQLKRYAKGITVKENEKALAILKDIGFNIDVGFIFFDPLATLNVLQDNIEFIERANLHTLNSRILGSMRVQAGSPYVKMMRAKNLLGTYDVNSMSYNCAYEIAEVAKTEHIFSVWESATRELIKLMDDKKRRTDMYALDFYFVKELVRNYIHKIDQGEAKTMQEYCRRRREMLEEFKQDIMSSKNTEPAMLQKQKRILLNIEKATVLNDRLLDQYNVVTVSSEDVAIHSAA
jgi:radical SAM superfamily enzyme YgiQ (UPF0313 family)